MIAWVTNLATTVFHFSGFTRRVSSKACDCSQSDYCHALWGSARSSLAGQTQPTPVRIAFSITHGPGKEGSGDAR